ncbi:MAG: hypothetical protein NZ553_11950, partial [Caldilinea sp.]|nr:hypothetical protein [Caldilinea sp.]MDW8441180.1 hypothetical protein [Caldilineaceae bacterium]
KLCLFTDRGNMVWWLICGIIGILRPVDVWSADITDGSAVASPLPICRESSRASSWASLACSSPSEGRVGEHGVLGPSR